MMADNDDSSFMDGVSTPDSQEVPEDPIIVLIVGETQHGKSTLIRQIGRYAGATDLDIKIGGGNKSCTTAVGQYTFSIPLQKYYLVDQEDKPITGMKFADLCNLTTHQAVAKTEELEDGRSTLFTFIDTPGLDDSDGDDLDIMAGIISRVSELQHLNAIIYVRSIEEPFSKSFCQFFSYIQQSMPSISAGIIVVHTRYTTEKTMQHLNDDTSFSNVRREAFKKATNLDTCHFFMDNTPDPDEPFANVQSMNEIFRLLLFMRSQNSIATGNLNLLKTRKMEYVDAHIGAALGTLRSKLDSKWNAEVATERAAKQDLHRKFREISNKRTLLKTHQDDIQAIRSETSILLSNRVVDEDYGFLDHFVYGEWRLKPFDVNFSNQYVIHDVKKTAGKGCKWQNEHQQGATWKGTLRANRVTSLVGSVTFYSTGALKYQDKLIHLEKECARLDGQLELLSQGFDQGQLNAEDNNPLILELENHVKDCTALIVEVDKRTFAMSLYPKLKHIYLLDKKPSRDDIFTFIQVYNGELADMYWRELNS